MPRLNAPRSIASEANLARRIAHEREARGLSYEALAKLMTEAGCPIASSAIFKIEKADPPRRITVNELAGLAAAFDLEVSDLLRPMDEVESEYARELVETMRRNQRNLGVLTSDMFNVLVDLGLASSGNREVYDYVMSNWQQNTLGLPQDEREQGRTNYAEAPLHEQAAHRIAFEAGVAMQAAMVRAATLWIEATTRGLDDDEADEIRTALNSDGRWIDHAGWLFDTIKMGETDG